VKLKKESDVSEFG